MLKKEEKKFYTFLIETGNWYSNFCFLNWKQKKSKNNRLYFHLSASNPKVKGKNPVLLLKTPCSSDAYSDRLQKKEQRFGNSGTLAQEVQTGFIYNRNLLPTPRAHKISGGDREDFSPSLPGLLINGLLPTPRSIGMDIHQTAATRKYRGNLEEYIAINFSEKLEKNTTNLLNPNFLAEMMDFPIDWTILPFTKQ